MLRPPLPNFFERSAAHPAGLTLATIYPKLLGKITRRPIPPHKISERGAALLNRISEYLLDGAGQYVVSRFGDAAGCAGRVDAGHKQGFIGVDIAHAYDDFTVHDELLDGNATPTRPLVQIRPGKAAGKGLRAEVVKKGMLRRLQPVKAAEAPRIVIAKAKLVIEHDIDVVVIKRGACRRA